MHWSQNLLVAGNAADVNNRVSIETYQKLSLKTLPSEIHTYKKNYGETFFLLKEKKFASIRKYKEEHLKY